MNDNLLFSAKAMDNYINEMTARYNFYEFINAINSKSDTNCQIQKTLSLIDRIIVSNESTGFKMFRKMARYTIVPVLWTRLMTIILKISA